MHVFNGAPAQGIFVMMKQWQHPFGQEHSEQRWRHLGQVRQQYHSPVVVHREGHPPHGHKVQFSLMEAQLGWGETHGLQTVLHPLQAVIEPRLTSVRESQRPVPSAVPLRSLKNWRLEERRARPWLTL
jgi:hypothetical protein